MPSERPIVIVGCGKAKRALAPGQTVPIAELYTGSLFRARMELARALGGPDFILSAMYGLARAGNLATPYEMDLRHEHPTVRAVWTARVVESFKLLIHQNEHTRRGPSRLVVIAAGPYTTWVDEARRLGWEVEIPAAGLPIGASIAELRRLADQLDVGDVVGMTDEVEAELPTYLDSEEAILPVPVLRELLRRAEARARAEVSRG